MSVVSLTCEQGETHSVYVSDSNEYTTAVSQRLRISADEDEVSELINKMNDL
jgi:hypothetical protein